MWVMNPQDDKEYILSEADIRRLVSQIVDYYSREECDKKEEELRSMIFGEIGALSNRVITYDQYEQLLNRVASLEQILNVLRYRVGV